MSHQYSDGCALAAAPEDPNLLNDFGYFLARTGRWSDAEAILKRSVQADPKLARAWVNLGTVYAKSGKVPESLQEFGHAVTPAEAKFNAGVILAGIGETAQAKVLLAQAGSEDPKLRTAADALLADRPNAEPVTKRN
jgi:Flp pilus assembly protein TadD